MVGASHLWSTPPGDRTAATRFDPAADERPAATEHAPAPPPPPKVIRTPRRRAHVLGGLAIFAALVALGLVASQLFGDPDGGAFATGPLTESEVRSAAEAFGDAYAAEDPAALRRSLARDVTRVLPGGRVDGREQVVDQYERQFDGKVENYSLDDLEVEGGRAGRAIGRYRVDRSEGDPYEGDITFGVVRERGEPRIKLIAATPVSYAALRDDGADRRAPPDFLAGLRLLVADCGVAGDDVLEQSAALLDLELEAGVVQPRLGVLNRQAREVGHLDQHLAPDPHGGHRRTAVARDRHHVDHVRARLERDLGGERAAADRGRLAHHQHLRALGGDGPADLHPLGLDRARVGRRRDREPHRGGRLRRARLVLATAAGRHRDSGDERAGER